MENIRKIIIPIISVVAGVFLLIGFTGFVTLNFIFSGMCGNQVVQEIASPDKKLKAVIFVRDCGATTAYATHVSVYPRNHKVASDDVGNIFWIDGGGPAESDHASVEWTSNRSLKIQYFEGCRHSETKVKQLSVVDILDNILFDSVKLTYQKY